MRVEKVAFTNKYNDEITITRYFLLDDNGNPVLPVMKYLKYLDNIGRAEKTLKKYCNHLKLYFEFLKQKNISYENVDLNLLSDFTGWLRNSYASVKVVEPDLPQWENRERKKKIRSNSTINQIVNVVVNFYEILFLNNELQDNVKAQVFKSNPNRFKSFKTFLEHVSKEEGKKNILKQPVDKRTHKTLTKKQIEEIQKSCTNIRDQLLIRVLYDSGMRIDETLQLWLEDFDISKNEVVVRKSKTKAGEGRTVYISSETMNLFQDYILEIHTEDIDTNFVFITLTGKNKGKPLKYITAKKMVEVIAKKTNIDFTPHMLRHTFATDLLEKGTNPAVVKELLGHEHIQTTLEIYSHPSKEFIRSEYEKAKGVSSSDDKVVDSDIDYPF